MSSVILPMEMLEAADQFQRARLRETARLQILLAEVAADRDAGSTPRPLLPGNCSLSDLEDVDLLYLPAIWRNPLPVLRQCDTVFPLLQRLASPVLPLESLDPSGTPCLLTIAALGRACLGHFALHYLGVQRPHVP